MSRQCEPFLARSARTVVLLLPVLFLTLFFLYPLFAIVRLSFADGLAGLLETLGAPYYWRVLAFTAGQAALSTALTLALGLPGAYVFARYAFPGKALLRTVAGIPFVMPTVVVAAAFGALLGPQGLINQSLQTIFGPATPPIRLEGLAAVLLAHVFYNYTVVVRLVGGFWANLDPRLEQAAMVLGASRLDALARVTLPLLAPALGAAALLIFIFTFTSFGVMVILGGPRLTTLEVEIYRQTAHLLRLDVAATLALIQLVCMLGLSFAYTRLTARATTPLELQPRSFTARPPRAPGEKLLVGATMLFIALLLGAPLAALALRSVLAPGPDTPRFTLAAYLALGQNLTGSAFFTPPTAAVANSLRIAATTTLLALSIGVPAAYLLARRPAPPGSPPEARRRATTGAALLDALFVLPLGTSAVTLGLGYLVALSVPGLGGLRTSPWLIPVLHTLVALPFVIRALAPVLRATNPRQREAAALLGASPVQAWLRVELPQIAPALVTGAVFAFTVSLGEFGATLLLARPEAPTLPVMIFRFLGQPGALNYGQALALATILMLVTALGFLLLERIRPPGGEF
ncbi:MAG: iron ABC transporter permease [Oscillochloridaceae bacterium]|nr:iron ABC transporter permease [Chloroflexaceae bacterium]MDW8392168.1 iron ABC transporter permease [Oscillochloridaceae bacterium]